jgi:hypothetical protein
VGVALERVVNLGVGVFVVRFVRSAASTPPTVYVHANPSMGVRLITAADENLRSTSISNGGAAVVICERSGGALRIGVQPAESNGSVDAEITVEPIHAVPSAKRAAREPQIETPVRRKSAVMAHVARRGDVAADMMDWVGGPDLPAQIEGIALALPDGSAGLELVYRVKLAAAGGGPGETKEGRDGGFAGSRGQARPVVELEVELRGPRSDEFILSCECLFLGAHVVSRKGSFVSFRGPTGREPLVGFRWNETIDLRQGRSEERAVAISEATTTIDAPSSRRNAGVRVFRSVKALQGNHNTQQARQYI